MVEKRKKSQWVRSGKEVSCSTTMIYLFTSNFLMEIAVCEGALSWWRNIFRAAVLAPQEFPELGYKTSGLQSVKVGNTVDGLYRCSPRTHQHHLDFRGAERHRSFSFHDLSLRLKVILKNPISNVLVRLKFWNVKSLYSCFSGATHIGRRTEGVVYSVACQKAHQRHC
jgi:hypothetical protein